MINRYQINRNKTAGFTLIELMVVIIVIAIVGGIVFGGAGYIFEKQAIKQANAEIEVLKVALSEYKSEHGTFPETFDNDVKASSFILLHSLYGTHELINETWERRKPEKYYKSLLPIDALSFLPFEEDDSGKFNLDQVDHYLVDPWGEPYIYQFERKDGNVGFLLYSKGPDKKSDPFNEVTDGYPQKRSEDEDNIPNSEPGSW